MIRRPPRSTQSRSSATSDVYKRQPADRAAAEQPDRPGGELSTHPAEQPPGVPQPLVVVDRAAHQDGVVLQNAADQARGENPHLTAAGVQRPTHGVGDPPRRAVLARERYEDLSLIHISEPTRLGMISYAVFC